MPSSSRFSEKARYQLTKAGKSLSVMLKSAQSSIDSMIPSVPVVVIY